MKASLSLLAILNLLGSAQALLLALALLSAGRAGSAARRVLAALVIAIAVVIFGGVMRTSHYEFVYPHLSRVHDPFVFLTTPLLFLYLRTLIRRERRLARVDYLHFLPFALCVAYLAPYYLRSSQSKLDFLWGEYYELHPSNGYWYYIRSGLLLLQAAAYLTLMISMFVRYSRALKAKGAARSEAEGAVLFHVRFMLYAFLALFVVGLLRYTLDHTARTNLIVPLGASAIIYSLAYQGLRRPELLTGDIETTPAPVAGTNALDADADGSAPAKKYEKSTLTPERAERYLRRLLSHMETEKPYVDGELTLPKLAERLSIPAPHLSQIINERLRQNFFDFVNTYRVEEAKRRLLDPAKQHYSVLAIAEEVGFNSKSSFNAVFKKHVQMTPSEFRRGTKEEG